MSPFTFLHFRVTPTQIFTLHSLFIIYSLFIHYAKGGAQRLHNAQAEQGGLQGPAQPVPDAHGQGRGEAVRSENRPLSQDQDSGDCGYEPGPK